ncbi:MAG: hypothetical protein IT432_12250 [Phycisphaerales bacterium]|nr:hypothetical protein [Phycisphaerales bacterium]
MLHTLNIGNPGPAPTRAIEVVSPPGSCIQKVSVAGQSSAPLIVMRRFDRWAAIVFDRNVPSASQDPLRIHIDSTSAIAPDWRLVQSSPAIGPWDSDPNARVSLAPPVAWMTIAELEARSMEHAPTPSEAAWARYFRELDLKTNPTLLHERGRATGCPRPQPFESLVKVMAGLLLERLHARVTGGQMPPAPPTCETVLLSALQLHLLEKHIGGRNRPDWASLVARAFASFASGRLLLDIRAARSAAAEHARSRSSNGGPNSAFVFLFAEFAAAAIDSDVDAEVWSKLLPRLVTAAEIYVRCYGELSNGSIVARRLGEYSDMPVRSMPPDELERLLAQHSDESANDAKLRLNGLARASLLPNGWSDGGAYVHHPDGCWFSGGTVEFPCQQAQVLARAPQTVDREDSEPGRADNP